MTGAALGEGARRDLQRLRDEGGEVFGPGPVTPGPTTPTADDAVAMPGMHVQVRRGHRLVEGFGATPDEAVRDVLAKLEGLGRSGAVRE